MGPSTAQNPPEWHVGQAPARLSNGLALNVPRRNAAGGRRSEALKQNTIHGFARDQTSPISGGMKIRQRSFRATHACFRTRWVESMDRIRGAGWRLAFQPFPGRRPQSSTIGSMPGKTTAFYVTSNHSCRGGSFCCEGKLLIFKRVRLF